MINFSSNEFQPTPVKSMPKPAPVKNYSQPAQPVPFNHPQPKPALNSNKSQQGGSNLGNRTIKKGTASLNRNENATQVAQCYACGVHIRYSNFSLKTKFKQRISLFQWSVYIGYWSLLLCQSFYMFELFD